MLSTVFRNLPKVGDLSNLSNVPIEADFLPKFRSFVCAPGRRGGICTVGDLRWKGANRDEAFRDTA
jgi:hypothetical protein